MAHSSTTHDQLTDLDEICFNFWQHVTIFLLTLPHTIPIDFKIWGKILRERKDIMPINNWCWQLPFGYAPSVIDSESIQPPSVLQLGLKFER